jgi:hypothetical protein
MRCIALLAVITGLFLPFLALAPAHAQATRTWVSGVGDDANPCSRTAPCKTFAGAISKTAANGEINCLDPGGFGAVTITKAITISCEAGTAGVLVSGANGIIVNAAAADVVTLKGLDIDGVGTGLNGIRFLAGAALVVDTCVIRGFTSAAGFGISFAPTTIATLHVINSVIMKNGSAGGGGGLQVNATGGGFARAMITRSVIDRNFVGVSAVGTGPTSAIQVFQSAVSHNSSNGLLASGAGAVIKVGGSAVIGNGSAATSGNVLSYLNNEISDNGTDTSPATAGGLK